MRHTLKINRMPKRKKKFYKGAKENGKLFTDGEKVILAGTGTPAFDEIPVKIANFSFKNEHNFYTIETIEDSPKVMLVPDVFLHKIH